MIQCDKWLLPEEFEDKWINCSVPGGIVVNDEQVNSAGLGVQFPLLWHVTLRTCSSVVSYSVVLDISFSQVNSKIEPSSVEL